MSKATQAPDPSPAAEVKAKRVHTISGIPYPITRTYFDSHLNSVIDVFEKKKIVQNRKGEDVEVTLLCKVRCADEEIQTKYVRRDDAVQEIVDVN